MWRNDKTSFLLLIVFLLLARLSQNWASPIAIYTQVHVLATMGFVFMLAFLLARAWRLSQAKSHKSRRSWWIALLSLSVLIWWAGMISPVILLFGYCLWSWQLLIIGGLIFGYYNPEITRWWESLHGQARWMIVVVLAAATVLAWCTYTVLLQQPQFVLIVLRMFDSVRLGPGLLLLFGAWLPLLYHTCHHIEAKLQHKTWL